VRSQRKTKVRCAGLHETDSLLGCRCGRQRVCRLRGDSPASQLGRHRSGPGASAAGDIADTHCPRSECEGLAVQYGAEGGSGNASGGVCQRARSPAMALRASQRRCAGRRDERPATLLSVKGIKGWFFKRYHEKAGGAVPSANRITLLRDADADGVAETRSALLTGLSSPFGMALVRCFVRGKR
jgi:hypothetical protein